MKLQSKPPFAAQPWPLRGRIGLNERRRFDMVLVTHMKGPLKEPGLARSRPPVWTNITVAATGQASGPTRLQRSVGQTSGLPVGRASGPPVAASRGCRDWQVGDLPHAASLLWMTVPAGTNAGTYFSAYDGNGNVMALVSAADGSIAARYEYGPFGEVIQGTGPMAKANPFRFSTQYQGDETDLVCYLHRYYSPSTGRWLSKDPLGEPGFRLLAAGEQPNLVGMSDDDIERVNQTFNEPGGPNLYGFCANSPINKVDRLGLDFNWGTPGPIPPAEKGAYGPFYNPEPPWFMHPADEGKPCCCKDGPVKITVKRTDTVGLLQIVMKIDLQITGCYKDLFVIWDTCWRKMDPPWKGEESGALWKDLNSTSSVFPAYGTVYRTKAHVRLLSCEDGKWKVRGAKAGRGYTRSAPMLPWDYADSTGYY
ncbi:MAG TPA: RHS repeat-associated core domain-containing protein [Candidatus Paceibacterota bacterium]|nr:RHS repeat-associated core domain-containing protein [Candidatus Paceibacterota bacterium]